MESASIDPEIITGNSDLSADQAAALLRSKLEVSFATAEQRAIYDWIQERKRENLPRLEAAVKLAQETNLDLRSAWNRLTFQEEAAALEAGFSSAFGLMQKVLAPPRPRWFDRAEALCGHAARELMGGMWLRALSPGTAGRILARMINEKITEEKQRAIEAAAGDGNSNAVTTP